MIGRTTSRMSIDQKSRAVLWELRCVAWALTDAMLARSPGDEQVLAERGRPPVTTCIFHIGFVSIIESDEHLRRLRNEPVSCGSGPARPALMRTIRSQFISPIDGTAARVAGGKDGR